jgi:predicted permease
MIGFESALTILLMIAIGAAATWRLKLDEASSAVLSALVVSVALPAYLIDNMMNNYDRAALVSMAPGLVVPLASIGICAVTGLIVAKVFNVAPRRRGLFVSMFSLSNTVFMGLPVNLMLFGDSSIPFVLLYYVANTTILWTFGVYSISHDGPDRTRRVLSAANLKRFFSPPLFALILTIAAILLGLTPPRVILKVCKTVGSMTTPLSMIFIGIILFGVDWKKMRPDKELFLLLAGRFVVAPLVIVILCRFIPLPLLMKKVFVIQASMPILTQASIIARTYDADYRYAAVMTSVTTLASLVTIPIYVFVMNQFNIFG